jgi:hypothetical protein
MELVRRLSMNLSFFSLLTLSLLAIALNQAPFSAHPMLRSAT